MRGWKSVLVTLAAILVPTTAVAQASLSGIVRDSSGAVLPGVSVEASSPVLIEKVRTAVTDDTGRYQIIDLRPGSYQVTFTLTGARLREVLEHGVSATSVGTGAFLQVSGVAFTYDPTAQSGGRITGQLHRPNGTPIAPAESLKVSFVAYPACEGGDGYRIPEAARACERAAEGPRTADLLIEHLRKAARVGPPAGGRIRRMQP